ncbi:MAG TPA: helix-hairpin-helix domain-containing protein [Bacteroidia bacterium]|nr:helix-hairpin-helix domain-containing protein [Bacteroidia bacterium]
MWPEFLHTFFGFNRQQRNGVLILLVLSLLSMLLNLFYSSGENEVDFRILNLPVISYAKDSIHASPGLNASTESLKPFYFDPNTANHKDLVNLGLKPATARALIHFREKGFVFKSAEDLKKVYGMKDSDVNRLSAFVRIVSEKKVLKNEEKDSKQPEKAVAITSFSRIELNTADSIQLLDIRGIGPVFAGRIIKYRNLLGGYVNSGQLAEVYGMKPEQLESIKSQIRVDSSAIRKLHLNSDEFKLINKHPYIDYDLCKRMVKTRKTAKLNKSMLKELLQNETLYLKLLPYCDFE